jgi:hypothetical protein
MSLISLLVAVIIVGLIVWLIRYLPLPPPFRTIATVIVVIILILWLLSSFTGWGHDIYVGHGP